MARPAHPHAMQPARAGPHAHGAAAAAGPVPVRGALPRLHALRSRPGAVYLLVGFVVLRVVWALGERPGGLGGAARRSSRAPATSRSTCSRSSASCFVGVRFFRLFPKSQPPRIGPAKPPPGPVIHAMLYAAWIGVTLVFATILAGGLF